MRISTCRYCIVGKKFCIWKVSDFSVTDAYEACNIQQGVLRCSVLLGHHAYLLRAEGPLSTLFLYAPRFLLPLGSVQGTGEGDDSRSRI